MQQIWKLLDYLWLAGKGTARVIASAIGIGALCLAGAGQPAAAATRCVNPGGTGGCFASIGAAVTVASPGDTIQVAHGTYKEYVVIPKSLSLIGANQENTIVDALNKPFGINVDGHNNVGLSGVVISGFTVKNANNAGIVISNASAVTVSENRVLNNDKGLVPGNPTTCPSLSAFPYFTGEAEDCGEGILLSGVDHSTLANNTVTGNAGGILVTDDTGPTHDNLITGNSVVRNTALDCGITLPSHSPFGVFHNTVSGNDSSYNGGPGVGIFAPGPGSKAYGNVVINNRLRGNGLPGVTMHNHAAPGVNGVPPGLPPPIFNDNVILGNDISDNSQDFGDAATAGPTGINIFSLAPMTGTLISQNVIHQEAFDIVIKVPATGSVPAVQIHLNNFPDNQVGLQNAGTAVVDATQNWWGCSGGPAANGCATVSGTGVLFAPWLTKPFQAREDN
jgi:parallel beta-helix repeat protein